MNGMSIEQFKDSELYKLGIEMLMKLTPLKRLEVVQTVEPIFKYLSTVPTATSIKAIDSITATIADKYKTTDLTSIFIVLLAKEEVQIKFNIDAEDSIRDYIGWLYVYYMYTTSKGLDCTPLIEYLRGRLYE